MKQKWILVATALLFAGLGLLLHDFAHAEWELGGLDGLIGLHGAYIGTVLIVLGWILMTLVRKKI